MLKISLTITLILLAVGFVPYSFPRNPDSLTDSEMLVDRTESTCTSDFYVVSGKLIIPQDIKSYFPNAPTEFNIDSSGVRMVEILDSTPGLNFDNQFIISGKVTGVDSSQYKYCETNYPYFKIEKWSPTNYNANFWSFSKPVFILYFLTLFACTLTSIILFFLRRPRKSKT